MKFQDIPVGNRFMYKGREFTRLEQHAVHRVGRIVNACLTGRPDRYYFGDDDDVNLTYFQGVELEQQFSYRGVTLEKVKQHERKVFGIVNTREPNPSPKCKDGSWAFLDDRDMVEVA